MMSKTLKKFVDNADGNVIPEYVKTGIDIANLYPEKVAELIDVVYKEHVDNPVFPVTLPARRSRLGFSSNLLAVSSRERIFSRERSLIDTKLLFFIGPYLYFKISCKDKPFKLLKQYLSSKYFSAIAICRSCSQVYPSIERLALRSLA